MQFYLWFNGILSYRDSLYPGYVSSRKELASRCKTYITKCVCNIFGKIAHRNEWNHCTFLVVDARHTKKTTQFKDIWKQKEKFQCNSLHLTIPLTLSIIAKLKHFVLCSTCRSWCVMMSSIFIWPSSTREPLLSCGTTGNLVQAAAGPYHHSKAVESSRNSTALL